MAASEARAARDVEALRARFFEGRVIPAHPLALDASRRLDERRQRALSRYYLDAGAGGLAVGVHTTQFAIREAGILERVLAMAAEEARTWPRPARVEADGAGVAPATTAAPLGEIGRVASGIPSPDAASEAPDPPLLIAGACGRTAQAVAEARLARALGYDAVLLSLAALRGENEDALVRHAEAVADVLPLVGFYLQPAVGGIVLDASFWARFARIPNVVAIKVAPFDRYRTLEVVRGVVAAGAERRVALYTGNDDHIVEDLVTPFVAMRDGAPVQVRFAGGLLGHWSVWTEGAVRLFACCRAVARAGSPLPPELAALASRVTDCNAAFFDVANGFAGCIAGCHEVLRGQGLLDGIWCLDPHEGLGPGQRERIDRVRREHADLADDAFVAANLQRWLA